MARQPRLSLPGEAHLVAQRGHNRQPVFLDEIDRQRFLGDLRDVLASHRLALHAYGLLTHQVVLLVTPGSDDSLSRAMQALGRRYVPWHNQRHQRSGGLWEGRFRTCVVEGAEPLLQVLRYIERLPLLDGLAPDLLAEADSSAAHHLGVRRDSRLIDPAPYWALGNTPFDREAHYRHWLLQEPAGEETASIEAALRRGGVLGSPAFVQRLQLLVSQSLQPRPRGRPRKIPAAD